MKFLKFTILVLFSAYVIAQKKCAQKTYRGPDNPMNCVCNATYCDEVPPLGTLGASEAAVYTSSQSGKRFDLVKQKFDPNAKPNSIVLTPNDMQKNQTIIGFGGTLTDSAGVMIAKLSTEAQQNLINTYFAPEGIGYTMIRNPMASCDASTHNYTYDDHPGDMNLTRFNLTMEDYKYRIPFLTMMQTLIGKQFKLFASPWSAPAWMKVNQNLEHGGTLIGPVNGPYYETWTNYFIKYIEAYAQQNVSHWGLTMQNEPMVKQPWQSMDWNSTMERDYAKGLWGSTLRKNPLTSHLKLMVLDHDRQYVPDYVDTIFGDPAAASLLDGLAVHWYHDDSTSPTILSDAHAKLQDKFIIYTESSLMGGVKTGQWGQGNYMLQKMMDALQNWVTGWVDWSICMSTQGGPNWVGNMVDSAILVSTVADEFEKQPIFYALGHVSKFLVENSTMIGINKAGLNSSIHLDSIAGVTPAGDVVIIINNSDVNANYSVTITNKRGENLNLVLEARSFTTIVYKDV